MKTKILSGLILFFAFTFSACDVVEGPYVEGNPYDCNYNSNLPTRKVLIEDFTGYQCVNCPRATEELHRIMDLFPCHVVPVAIHYGFFAEPFAVSDADYRSAEGTAVGSFFSITEALPVGMVNRKSFNNDHNIQFENWSNVLLDFISLDQFADVEILCENTYNDGVLSVEISLNQIKALSGNYHLVAWITEDGIIGKQKDGSQLVTNYEHNHMLRTGILGDNPAWGMPVSIPEVVEKQYNWPMDKDWVVENCHLVVFVYDTQSKEVVQVEQFEINVN
jgi:hypothetical protein